METAKEIIFVLKLNQKEADWLHNMTQNYMTSKFETDCTESDEDQKIRMAIFKGTSTNNFGGK